MLKTKNKKLSKKKVALIVAGLVIIGGATAVYFYNRRPAEAPGQPTSPINYDPPTPEEEAESQARKQANQEQQNQTKSSADKKQVTPVVTNAAQSGSEIFISGYVSNIVEEGGTCTYNFAKGAVTFTKTTEGFVNVGNTNCTPLTLSGQDFAQQGIWQVTLTYNSESAHGVSQPKELEVK